LAAHAAELADFQHRCFEFCQRLLIAFAVALDVSRSFVLRQITSIMTDTSPLAIAIRVQLPQDFFSSQHHEGPDSRSILRFLHYPAIPGGANVEPNRAGAHSDYGSLTLLFQRKNGGEGLQILPPSEPLEGGVWRDTGMVDDALLVNVGDALELWSGARFKSTLHRVLHLLLESCLIVRELPLDLVLFFCAGGASHARASRGHCRALLDRMVQSADADREPQDLRRRDFDQRKCAVPFQELALFLTMLNPYLADDLARMNRKGVKPGTDLTADEHLQARLSSTYGLPKK
jgi:hypothetical protein